MKGKSEYGHKNNAYKAGEESWIEALATLGLTGEASAEDIREAYRHLAQIHHPDRFQKLGAEALAAATKKLFEYN